jgi:hypothetical protein
MYTRPFGSLAGAAALLFLGASACSNSGTSGRVSLSLSSRTAAGTTPVSASSGAVASPAVLTAGDSTVIATGNDTLIIRSMQVVLKKIELKRVEAASCDGVQGNGDCEEFEIGPALATFPLGSDNAATVAVVNAPAGQYDQLEFEIHKADSTSSEDATFLQANPDFKGISIKLTGTFSQSGTRSDFVFTSDLDASQELALNPPFDPAGNSNVTIRLDVSTWFVNGGALLDPASANQGGANEGVVKDNIKQSIEAFRDDNHDGRDDDHEGS